MLMSFYATMRKTSNVKKQCRPAKVPTFWMKDYFPSVLKNGTSLLFFWLKSVIPPKTDVIFCWKNLGITESFLMKFQKPQLQGLDGFGLTSRAPGFQSQMDVSKNRGTPKSSHFNGVFHYKPWVFHYKPSILGYPYCWFNTQMKLYTSGFPSLKMFHNEKGDDCILGGGVDPMYSISTNFPGWTCMLIWNHLGPLRKYPSSHTHDSLKNGSISNSCLLDTSPFSSEPWLILGRKSQQPWNEQRFFSLEVTNLDPLWLVNLPPPQRNPPQK